jgi:hypothetical protein
MNDPIEHLRQAGVLNTSPFAPTSRYHDVPIARLERDGADPIAYVRRRLIPRPEWYVEVGGHVVQEGDRIDLLAAEHLGDPELYWQIADANAAMNPAELTAEPGRRISITLPDPGEGGADA